MASPATFPNPYLVAILLVCNTRSGSGAQILFHYPPHPSSDTSSRSATTPAFDQTDDESTTDSHESTTDEDDHFTLSTSTKGLVLQNNIIKGKSVVDENERNPGGTVPQPTGPRKQHGESFFGLAEDGLVSLLSPERAWHKRKFEMGVNDLTFVGRPVFVRPDGMWRKDKKRKGQNFIDEPNASDTATDNEEKSEAKSSLTQNSDPNVQNNTGDRSPLTMFHVVFVMNPPPLEHTSRVKDMYDHVIKKFSRALKWEQGRSDYVRRESEIILSVKAAEIAKRPSPVALCSEIMAKSSLATAVSEVFAAISTSRIASITLTPKVSFSLQIPPVTFTSYLPSLTEPPIQPGLWLTTATDIGSIGGEAEDTETGYGSHLAKHYTLLLKSPPHRIAKDVIEAGGPLAAHLPKFVSSLRPTKSFYKLSLSTQTSLTDIQILARHLIYWRRAVAIPPLHQKDVYIVSPNADMRKLRESSKSYEQQFAPVMPNMPSLPKILSTLSMSPKAFRNLIPSSDHKEIYYLALAWLMRNGWVTQLRTFAYVRVDPEVKKMVKEHDREATLRKVTSQKSTKEGDNRTKDLGQPLKRPSIISRPSSDGKRSTDGGRPRHNPRMASLVLNPPRASPEESKWLEFIEASLVSGSNSAFNLSPEDRAELQEYWPSFVKYFNGQIALETVVVREGLKRKFFWKLLNKVGLDYDRQGGVEDENGTNKAILVPIHHW